MRALFARFSLLSCSPVLGVGFRVPKAERYGTGYEGCICTVLAASL